MNREKMVSLSHVMEFCLHAGKPAETDKECVTEPSVGSQPNRTGEGPTSPDTSAPARNDNTRRCESTKTEDGSALDSNESARVENPTDVGTKKGKGSSKEKVCCVV